MKKIIIDCDPGLDDAVALIAAFGAKDLCVLSLTTVAGNVKGPQTAYNARVIREVSGQDESVPVSEGAPRPILRDAVTAEDFHGSTGLGGINYPDPVLPLSGEHAVNTIIRLCRDAKDAPLTLIITGPMTNAALALTMSPDIQSGIAEIVLMGGADTEGGNITPFAEFNIYADPHAAAVVFGCGLPIRCLSLDVTHGIRTTKARLAAVRAVGNKQALAAGDLLDASCKLEFSAKSDRDAPLHDPSTVLAFTHPHLFKGRKANVSVVTEVGEQFGRTVPTFAESGNVLWYETADDDAVFAALCGLLEGHS
ncbi:MAG: nucleoside hydrolase [Henriciella sp.]|jgi:purine nucleosidase